MQLVGDRFVVGGDGRARDLATGSLVAIVTGRAGSAGEQRRWVAWCDELAGLHQRSVARLLDYGLLDADRRFEAWRCGPIWRGGSGAARSVRERAGRVLRACGHSCETEAVRESATGPVVLPRWRGGDAARDAAGGGALATGTPPCAMEERGIVARTRAEERALIDLIRHDAGTRPRAVVMFGPPGSGASTIVLSVARLARCEGLVPVAASLLDGSGAAGLCDVSSLLRGRRLLILDDGANAASMRALVDATLRTPRPHVLIVTHHRELRGVPGFPLRPIGDERLVQSVVPRAIGREADRLLVLARRSRGVPARFVAALFGPLPGARPVRPRAPALLAAEGPAVYAAGAAGPPGAPPEGARQLPSIGAAPVRWAMPPEVSALRARVGAAEAAVARGRHAAGERALRQAMGALARRGDWTTAARASVSLAAIVLARGRAKAAQALIEEARAWLERGDDPALRIDLAVLASRVAVDLVRLDEAESLAGAAHTAALARADGPRIVAAACALARVAFWRGHYADAVECLDAVDGADGGRGGACALRVWRSRAAVGLRDPGRAVAEGVEAVTLARAAGDGGLITRALSSLAVARISVGDLSTAGVELTDAHRAALAAREPMQAMVCRLLRAECLRRAGHPDALRAAVAHLRRLPPAALPPRVRAIVAALSDLAGHGRAPAPPGRHARAPGLGALMLLDPDIYAPHVSIPARVADDIVEIISTCHDARDETAVLQELCATLRRQLRAAAVACVGAEGTTLAMLAGDGPRIAHGAAERAMAAGIPIVPHRVDERIEAAAPVRYGGATIGAIVGRWTIGAPHYASRAPLAFTTAATAAAPFVSAALARRARAAIDVTAPVVGVSVAMGELRRAIERAAGAPFPVLIEGESGAGKELVARALHRAGSRRDRTFCTVNCAALPDELVESELFGHARGAFTGAASERAGVFEEAHGGTLFLDEIGELSLRAQAKVLRVIQEGELRRLGENASRRVDVRLVCATNRNLRDDVAAGRFRQDLLYRLDVLRIVVPPLRERRDDIPVLVEHFWREATARVGSRATLAIPTIGALARYDWPGNARELQNVLAALAVRAGRRGVVQPSALPPQFGGGPPPDAWRLDQARRSFEERFVRAALVRTGGYRTHAAAELGLTRQGLTKLMARLGIDT